VLELSWNETKVPF